jgi:uncharacterized protein (UPF0128 family)
MYFREKTLWKETITTILNTLLITIWEKSKLYQLIKHEHKNLLSILLIFLLIKNTIKAILQPFSFD